MKLSLSVLIMVAFCVSNVGCFGESSTPTGGQHSAEDVRFAFKLAVREQQIHTDDPNRQLAIRWWGMDVPFGKVIYEEALDIYELRFLEDSHLEIWWIDMSRWEINGGGAEIEPINFQALGSAVVLFCQDKYDTTGDCQYWISEYRRMAGM